MEKFKKNKVIYKLIIMPKEKTVDEFIKESIDHVSKNLLFVEKDGKIKTLDLNSVIAPQLTHCSSCEFSFTCEEKDKDSEEFGCIIERREILSLIDELKKDGVILEESDKLLVYPLIQNFLRMNRLYRLESHEKILSLMNTKDGQSKLKLFSSLLARAEDTYLKLLKELKATRKERDKIKKTNKEKLLEVWQISEK